MPTPNDRIEGWNGIARYLNKSIRTVQRWEQTRNLPVYRSPVAGAGRDTKSIAYSFAHELDEWISNCSGACVRNRDLTIGGQPDETAFGGQRGPDLYELQQLTAGEGGAGSHIIAALPLYTVPQEHQRVAVTRWVPPFEMSRFWAQEAWFKPAVFMSALPLILVVSWVLLRSPNPVCADVENNSRLVVFSAAGKPLWTKQFVRPLSQELEGHHLPWQVSPIDGVSHNEVLFGHILRNYVPSMKDKILCYSNSGRQRWEYSPGERVVWEGADYADDYRISDFSADGRLPNGERFIVVVSNHASYFPSEVSVLNARGDCIGQYWHTGHIYDHDVADVDRDGSDEIILGGYNQLHQKAFLAALRPDVARSISPAPAGYAPGTPAASELVYLEFPDTDVNQALGLDSHVKRVFRTDDRMLRVELELAGDPATQIGTWYFDPSGFRVTRVDLAEEFVSLHRQLEADRQLDHEIGPKENRQLTLLEKIR
jgi:hypothetical protein